MQSVYLYSLDECPLGEVHPYDRDKRPQPKILTSLPPPTHNYIDLLIRQHDQKILKDAQSIDFLKVPSPRPWPVLPFADAFARLLYPKAGLAAISVRDLDRLNQIHARYPNLNQLWLSKAYNKANGQSVLDLIQTLEKLLQNSQGHSSKEA